MQLTWLQPDLAHVGRRSQESLGCQASEWADNLEYWGYLPHFCSLAAQCHCWSYCMVGDHSCTIRSFLF